MVPIVTDEDGVVYDLPLDQDMAMHLDCLLFTSPLFRFAQHPPLHPVERRAGFG